MPTTYTHYRFGEDVLNALPSPLREEILPYRGLYDIGLHGPDLLFYYKALSGNPVSRTGFTMHERPGYEFFHTAKQPLLTMQPPEPGLAYLYGFICHFALDSICHPYVEQQVRKTGITHSEIEAELDRALMVMDGLNPITHRPTGHLKATGFHARIIAPFFPGISTKQILESIKSIRIYCNLLVAPSPFHRWFIFTILKIAHSYDSIHGMVINYEPNPNCQELCHNLEHLYHSAIPCAIQLIQNYTLYLTDSEPLDSRFSHTFGEE